MKKLVGLFLTAVLLASCGQNSNKKAATESEKAEVSVRDVAEMLKDCEQLLDKEVIFKGWVSHTCKHSGRRCFLKSEDGSVSVRVEATGKIKGFNKELTGENMTVTGILKVNKLSEQYLDDWQAKVEATSAEEDVEEGGEHCSAELNNIQEMRDWMKENGKDYYPIYYVNGTDYEVIQTNEQ